MFCPTFTKSGKDGPVFQGDWFPDLPQNTGTCCIFFPHSVNREELTPLSFVEAFVCDLSQGKPAKDTAARFGLSNSWAHDLKESLAEDLREYFGEEAIADSMQVPLWRGNTHADKERFACRADRRRG